MSFNYNHLRAKKSRLMNGLRPFLFLLKLLKIIGILSGFSLILIDSAYGWLILSLSGLITIFIHWWNGELHRLAPGLEMTIEGQMASNILGKLSKNPTSEQIAKIVLESSGGKFIVARFGLGKTTIESLAQIPQNSPEQIFQTALQIQQKLETKTVSGSVLALAIIRNFPNFENLLAQFYADFEDLERGVLWHDHIFSLINQSKIPIKTGGIARDWSFGYTPTLNRFGINITSQVSNNILMSSNLEQHKDLVSKMVEQFSGNGKQNIALIGIDGVGKTTVVNSFAAKIANGSEKIPSNLKYRQVISLDASSLIAAAPGRGEIENLLNYILNEAYAAKNIIICLDNAQLFFEDGVGSVDVSNLLLPIIQAGALRMILTLDEQRFLQISAKNPSLAQAMNRLQVKPANYDETLAVMQDKLLVFEHQNGVFYQFQALKEAFRLSERYIFDLEMPGRAVRLLEMSVGFADNKIVTAS